MIKYKLPYSEKKILSQISKCTIVKDAEEILENYLNKIITINNLKLTNELFIACERRNKTLDEQFNRYIYNLNQNIHHFDYFGVIQTEDKEKFMYLIKHRIKMMKIRLLFLLKCQSLLNVSNNLIVLTFNKGEQQKINTAYKEGKRIMVTNNKRSAPNAIYNKFWTIEIDPKDTNYYDFDLQYDPDYILQVIIGLKNINK
jgi:hypothetical protein